MAMTVEIDWIADRRVSSLMAAESMEGGRLGVASPADPALETEIAAHVRLLRALVADETPPAEKATFWPRLIGLCLGGWKGQPQAPSAHPQFFDHIDSIHALVSESFPRHDAELPTRAGPLRMQWEARGPGLLHAMQPSLSCAAAIDQPVRIALVHPWTGGSAVALPAQRAVVMEALLTNAYDQLPEVLRLAWAICLVLSAGQLSSPLDLIPPLLQAAEQVDLAKCDPATIGLASKVWTAMPQKS